jgi:hypothetical protein
MGKVLNFSLPAGITCPGSSDWCRKFCYAKKGTMVFPTVKKAYEFNWAESKQDSFVTKILYELDKSSIELVRIHVAGDFYNTDYIDKWIKIIEGSIDKMFFAATKSWRDPKLIDSLEQLKYLPNMSLKASTDDTTGAPPGRWKEMGIEKTTSKGTFCGYQTKGIQCSECQACWDKNLNIIMHKH